MQGKGGQCPKKLLPILQDPVPFGTPRPNGPVDRVLGPVQWRPGPQGAAHPPPARRCNTGSEKPQRESRRPRLALTHLCAHQAGPLRWDSGASPHTRGGGRRGQEVGMPAPRALQEGAPLSFPPPLAQARVGPWGKLAGSLHRHRGRQAAAGEDRRRRGGGRIQMLCAHLCRAVCL